MKPFAVEMSIKIIVMADDEDHAEQVAAEHIEEYAGGADADDFDARGCVLIDNVATLPGNWPSEAVPYGGDGETELELIIAEMVGGPAHVLDPHTTDMFASEVPA
ncbi:hypothetical protein [Burkholderia gladioli]|uniref:hypothetical protein n=1 Tax=Burkholderia gladioli TaxID=28095 RepID=UPI00163F3EA8|nr:hypothetical protein [Burkholderia gladioli]